MRYNFVFFLTVSILLIAPCLKAQSADETIPLGFNGNPLKYQRIYDHEKSFPEIEGFYVTSITNPKAPAVAAGLRLHDVVHSVGDTRVNSYREIQKIFDDHSGKTLNLNIYKRSPKYEKKLRENPFYSGNDSRDQFESSNIEVPLQLKRPESIEVVQRQDGSLFHRKNLEHSPPSSKWKKFDSRKKASQSGLSPCPICFAREESTLQKLLEQGLGETKKVISQFRDNFETQPGVSGSLQGLVGSLEDSLISSGKSVDFLIVQTDSFYAYGLRDGTIILSEGLLKSLESREEKAALLAKMLAHYDRNQNHNQVETKRFRSLIERAIKQTTGVGLNFEDIKDWSPNLPGFSYYQEFIEEGYGESQEREAYFFALVILQRSGFSTAGLNDWLKKRRDMQDELHPKWVDYQLIHPIPSGILRDIEIWKRQLSDL